jgi:LysR family transcriptional regulator, mexEF-oprN operon transcriptional activator
MPKIYGRDLDLNLLRVFAVVAESGSVTGAAHRLYMTQPAVSAALRRLTTTVGVPLFVRSGRGLALTSRGERLRAGLQLHLEALVDAALAPPTFDPATNDRTLRLGLSDSAELWLLPPLLRALEREAPRMRLIAIPVQFRTVAAALVGGLAAAVTVADDLPATIRRERLFNGGFTCLYDPRHVRLRRLTEAEYFARDHVIVSYNGDLRGIVEDLFEDLFEKTRKSTRNIRCSVSSFANLGALIDGTAMLATIPALVATQIRLTRPHLRTKPLPFAIEGAHAELLWPNATDDDEPCKFVRTMIRRIAKDARRGT